MITAVDTNILLDVFLPDPQWGEHSLRALEVAYNQGALVMCTIVYAELVPQFEERSSLDAALQKINCTIETLDRDVAFLAGQRWGLYRKQGGKRERIITDFLIGAHALLRAERFLTRDRGFYRQWFQDLVLLETR
ncbi:MAG: type II toxin-antitoxin system VapC family toxin [Deltaproteobacteria bacterium]|nr:type II toxin-antitoxin system VapC family toxin [Deltaproteobacteria bacterium]